MQLPGLSGDVTELNIDASHESYDPLDETLALFRANTFFRNFEVKGPADRVLIYGILFVSEVIQKIKPQMPRREAEKAVMNLALDTNFAIPGDATFPLNQAFEPPRDRQEAEVLRQYISQMRQELANRLLNRIYADGDAPSKVRTQDMSRTRSNAKIALAVVVEFHKKKVHGQGPLSRRQSLEAPCSSLQNRQHSPNLRRQIPITRDLHALDCPHAVNTRPFTKTAWDLTLLLIGEEMIKIYKQPCLNVSDFPTVHHRTLVTRSFAEDLMEVFYRSD
jgi:actin related protein 2/3 complex subunit 3